MHMTSWIRFLVITLVILFGYLGYQKIKRMKVAYQKEVRQETAIKYLNQKKLAKKLEGDDPLWMEQQLAEDFAHFKEQSLTDLHINETFKTIQKNYPRNDWIRYRIIKQKLYRYFPKGEAISTIDNDIEKAFKTIIHLRHLKDLDLIVVFEDGIPLAHMPKDFYLTEDPHFQAPVLVSAKQKGTPHAILIPDWRSVSWWWARDIKEVEKRSHQTRWNEKIERGVWRGSLTRSIRLKACEIARQHPDILDAKLNVQVDDPNLQTYIEKNGMFGDRVEWDDFLKHKFLPILDGVMCAAPALQWRLLSKCLTLKQESDEIQWFYKGIHPYQHYVPIQNDLSDITQQIEWAKMHDKECEEISKQAYLFAKNNLMMEDVYHYFIRVLDRYGKLQKIDRSQLLSEMSRDPQWVCIQHRKDLRKKLALHPSAVHTATPY